MLYLQAFMVSSLSRSVVRGSLVRVMPQLYTAIGSSSSGGAVKIYRCGFPQSYAVFRRRRGLAARSPFLAFERVVRFPRASTAESRRTSHARSPARQPMSFPSRNRCRTQPSVQPMRATASSTVSHFWSGDATIMLPYYRSRYVSQTTQYLPCRPLPRRVEIGGRANL